MLALIQICIVIATIGLLAIALMTVRMAIRLDKATEDLSQLTRALRGSLVKIDLITDEARALVASLRDCVPPVLRSVERLEAISRRGASLSSAILEQVELPVFAAAALARGMRSGASHFLKRMLNRLTHRDSPIHGGNNHE